MTKKRLIDQFNLRSRLHFDIQKGHIWLDQNRMLLHASAFSELRRDLIENYGIEKAKGTLLRMGFVSGQQDANLAYKLYGEGDNYDVFRVGPELHGFEGVVRAEVTDADIDWEAGVFYGRAECHESLEAECHIRTFGIGDHAVCWALAGYASGYVTGFFKRFIVFKESDCTAKGDDRWVITRRTALRPARCPCVRAGPPC